MNSNLVNLSVWPSNPLLINGSEESIRSKPLKEGDDPSLNDL
jgi:hypothetical protein